MSWSERVSTNRSEDTLNIVEPVFVKINNLPPSCDDITIPELCISCEEVSGHKTMEGAQRIGGLWRLYPNTTEARSKLLVSGLKLNGIAVPLYNRNPFLMRDSEDTEIPSTRVTISKIPLSYSNLEIEQALEALSVTLLSKVRYELARDKNNRLTRFKTGRRFVFTSIPDSPLPRNLNLGTMTGEIYHKEQRAAAKRNTAECFKCLERGHMASSCLKPLKCRDCRQEGHRSGDPACTWLEKSVTHENSIAIDKENFPSLSQDTQSQSSLVIEDDKVESDATTPSTPTVELDVAASPTTEGQQSGSVAPPTTSSMPLTPPVPEKPPAQKKGGLKGKVTNFFSTHKRKGDDEDETSSELSSPLQKKQQLCDTDT